MKLLYPFTFAALVGLGACGPQRQPQEPMRNETAPVLPAPSAPPAVSTKSSAPQPPAQAQPKAAADSKSSEAAVDIVRRFADLLNAGKFNEAYMLLGPTAPPRSEFDRQFSRYSNLKATVGPAGGQEGAAGSIYLSVPLSVTGEFGAKQTSRTATAILRRVNDVPGSTDAQRRWHIERINWASGG